MIKNVKKVVITQLHSGYMVEAFGEDPQGVEAEEAYAASDFAVAMRLTGGCFRENPDAGRIY